MALASLVVLATGCDDLGSCPDSVNGGRKTVEVGGQVMYAGQAIIVKSCVPCHSTNAKGDARKGAPAGLDFDIAPGSVTKVVAQQVDGKTVYVGQVDDAELSRLSRYQRKVFDVRDDIWEQVDRDLMPPKGLGEGFRDAPQGAVYVTYAADGTCTRGDALSPIKDKAAKEELRQWLACGSPVVEANGEGVTPGVAGTVGTQFSAQCGGGMAQAPFDELYTTVFQADCVSCHNPTGQWPLFDLSTPEIAYTSLLGADGKGAPSNCPSNNVPMVTPNDVSKSYLVSKVGGGGAICGSQMPTTGPIPSSSVDLIKSWIELGAPGPGVTVGDAGAGGDAGALDAGGSDGGLDGGN